jgi:hypothetical protein
MMKLSKRENSERSIPSTPAAAKCCHMSIALDDKTAQLRAKMALLRRQMHTDARRIAVNANQLLDWKDYVRQYPRVMVAVGLLTGFVLGPGRRVVRSVKLSQESINELLFQSQSQQRPALESPRRFNLTSGAIRMLSGLALSGASLLLRKTFESYLRNPATSDKASTIRPGGSD